jgi:uncharacterized protein YerC
MDINEIEEYDIEIPEADPAFEILLRMIRNKRPIKHIAEDTGYSEDYITRVKEIT